MLQKLMNFIKGPMPQSSETVEEKREMYGEAVRQMCAAGGESGCDEAEAALKTAAFSYSLRRKTGSRKLVVMLSATSKYTLQKYEFDADVLFLSDISGTYFCIPCEEIAALVSNIAWRHRYKSINFIGCSKGGTGALSIATVLHRIGTRSLINVFSFSPQTQIYPHHTNGDVFPSYKNLKGRLEKQPPLVPLIARCGTLVALDYSGLNSCTVIYGEKNKVDTYEALRLKHCRGIKFLPIDTAQHYTLGFFTIPANVDIEHAREKFAEADDPDVVAMRNDNAIEEYLEKSKRFGYDLRALIA